MPDSAACCGLPEIQPSAALPDAGEQLARSNAEPARDLEIVSSPGLLCPILDPGDFRM